MARKRKLGKRELNGRLSRRRTDVQARQGETEAETLSTALEARARLYGLPEKFLRDERAGSVVGRMSLSGQLSSVQYRAAIAWIEVRNAYAKALLARSPANGAGTRGTPDEDSDQYIEWCGRAIEKYEDAVDVLRDLSCSVRSANIFAAVDVTVVQDIYLPHLEGDLRLALNALARHWGLDAGRAGKAA